MILLQKSFNQLYTIRQSTIVDDLSNRVVSYCKGYDGTQDMNFFLFSQGFDICVSSSTALGQWGEILPVRTFYFYKGVSVKKTRIDFVVIHENNT